MLSEIIIKNICFVSAVRVDVVESDDCSAKLSLRTFALSVMSGKMRPSSLNGGMGDVCFSSMDVFRVFHHSFGLFGSFRTLSSIFFHPRFFFALF